VKIVEQGITKEVLQAPQHPYTKALLACRPAGKAKGERLPVVSDFIGGENNRQLATDNRQEIISNEQTDATTSSRNLKVEKI